MFPQGFYWYGGKRHGPDHPPKHVQKKLEQITPVIDVPAAVIPSSKGHMIVTDDSNGGESNCEDVLDISDSTSVLKQQVINPQLTEKRQEKEAKKASHKYNLRRRV